MNKLAPWQLVFVVTRGNDPFEPGGDPFAVYESEQDAWDRLAEEVALDASDVWDDPYQRHGRTMVRVMMDEASVYEVSSVPWWPAYDRDAEGYSLISREEMQHDSRRTY